MGRKLVCKTLAISGLCEAAVDGRMSARQTQVRSFFESAGFAVGERSLYRAE
jgi:hypothetical protein